VAAAAAGELGCGSPATVWRRLDEWAKAGVFDALHGEVLDRLGLAGRLDCRGRAWTRSACGPSGGDLVGANPVDRGKPGSKLHLVTDGHGLPLAVAVTAANVNDGSMFEALLDDVPAVLAPSGRRRCRLGKVHADKGDDARHCRAYLRRRGIKGRIARRGIESSERLGRQRWRVERSLSWLSCYRRLAIRWDRDAGRFFALVLLACALVCCNRL